MKMVAVPYASILCRVCAAPATRAVREYSIGKNVRGPWHFYCDKHGPKETSGYHDYYQEVKEVKE